MSNLIKIAVIGAVIYGIYIGFLRPDWYELADPEGLFVAYFPAEPIHEVENLFIREGYPRVKSDMYQYRTRKIFFIAGSAQGLAGVSAKEVSKIVGKVFARELGAAVLSHKPVTQDGQTGIETRMIITGTRFSIDMRTFVVGDRVYLVGAGSNLMGKLTTGRGRFFKSFDFL